MDRCQAVVQVLCALLGNTSIVGRVPKGEAAASLIEAAYELVDGVEDGAYDRVEDFSGDEPEDAAEPETEAEDANEPEATEPDVTDQPAE